MQGVTKFEVDDGHILFFGERESTPSHPTRQWPTVMQSNDRHSVSINRRFDRKGNSWRASRMYGGVRYVPTYVKTFAKRSYQNLKL